ncbi:HNH endonuclease [Parasediminibacterium sp. JCM 36343]|uniref:HNH endonuclease n=1 Tax=Parasediminibacterium sp. JCM 36343 TaxID=3374279 RepID=UPI00397E46DD
MIDFAREQWKPIEFDFDFEITNQARFEISSYGRVRSFHKKSNGNILKTLLINGYEIIRLKFFTPRDKETQAQFDAAQAEILSLYYQLARMKKAGENETKIAETTKQLSKLKINHTKKIKKETLARTINWHCLIHRLVAKHFLEKPTPGQTIVAHIDFEKLNNRYTNLKWMTPAENYKHQQKSPYVIEENMVKKKRDQTKSKSAKLTVTRVMLLKKMLNEGKPMKQLVKFFKITETQILRIKRGENWKNIEAAN